VYRTGVYSAGVSLKDPALDRFPDIKKKKEKRKKNILYNDSYRRTLGLLLQGLHITPYALRKLHIIPWTFISSLQPNIYHVKLPLNLKSLSK
jgi:hypothetical protein